MAETFETWSAYTPSSIGAVNVPVARTTASWPMPVSTVPIKMSPEWLLIVFCAPPTWVKPPDHRAAESCRACDAVWHVEGRHAWPWGNLAIQRAASECQVEGKAGQTFVVRIR